MSAHGSTNPETWTLHAVRCRYWQPLGPQQTLYLPGVWLKEGDNEVLLLELEDPPPRPLLLSLDTPDFSGSEIPPSAAVV
jgi:hypothetical protein